ncbi:MAG: NTP transferase domain-containing protein [Nigerium sp.]|nr:NTP transferase domain-containing protein [Nigerium sp.]
MRRVAVVLGGGRSSRMGLDKLTLRIGGRPLLARCVDAALAWAPRVVVAGDEPEDWAGDSRVRFRREDPPFGGPVAGIAAALALVEDADEVLILAGDLAHPDAAVGLLATADAGLDGVVLEDADGWPQYLAGRYAGGPLRRAVARLDGDQDVSVRRLMRAMDVARLRAPEAATRDLDTPEVAKLAGAEHPHLR